MPGSVVWSFTTATPGFQDRPTISGLAQPTVVQFASDGRVFVAEKSGLIKVFDNLEDSTPTIFADLRTNVHNFWDRGLLGMALHPNFPTTPYVYVLYTYDAVIGGAAPRWGTVGGTSDGCPSPPGATANGCVVSGRLSRLTANGNIAAGPEQPLINDWYHQFPGHSIGTIAFGADGALYASGGDGASFNFADYGQTPANPPSGDPANQGGALRSLDLRTSGDPVGLNGAVIRIDPATGRGCRTIRGRVTLTRTPGALLPMAFAIPFASRSTRDERTVGGRRRLERLGGNQFHCQRRRRSHGEFWLAVL